MMMMIKRRGRENLWSKRSTGKLLRQSRLHDVRSHIERNEGRIRQNVFASVLFFPWGLLLFFIWIEMLKIWPLKPQAEKLDTILSIFTA